MLILVYYVHDGNLKIVHAPLITVIDFLHSHQHPYSDLYTQVSMHQWFSKKEKEN